MSFGRHKSEVDKRRMSLPCLGIPSFGVCCAHWSVTPSTGETLYPPGVPLAGWEKWSFVGRPRRRIMSYQDLSPTDRPGHSIRLHRDEFQFPYATVEVGICTVNVNNQHPHYEMTDFRLLYRQGTRPKLDCTRTPNKTFSRRRFLPSHDFRGRTRLRVSGTAASLRLQTPKEGVGP